jgi:hypothetical protein
MNKIIVTLGEDAEFDQANVAITMEVDEVTGLGASWYASQDGGWSLNVGQLTKTADGRAKMEILGHYQGNVEEQRAEFREDFQMEAPPLPTQH